ncbi:MAG: TonB-dependent receptor domain-containing protein, partial [Bdellovibrionales bacterium]
QYQNTARVRTQGIETSGSYALDGSNTLQISYAYQDPQDLVRDERLRRRPLDSGSLRWLHNHEKWGGSLEGTGIGTRRDFFGTARYKFAGYFLINSSLRYSPDELNSYSLRISNWFDVRPQVSIDFYGEGRQMLVAWERVFLFPFFDS